MVESAESMQLEKHPDQGRQSLAVVPVADAGQVSSLAEEQQLLNSVPNTAALLCCCELAFRSKHAQATGDNDSG